MLQYKRIAYFICNKERVKPPLFGEIIIVFLSIFRSEIYKNSFAHFIYTRLGKVRSWDCHIYLLAIYFCHLSQQVVPELRFEKQFCFV